MSGRFFAVGVGPGDPELLTLKAVRTMEACEMIVAPKSGGDKNIALQITKEFIEGKEILEVDMPMTKDEEILERCHDEAAKIIAGHLEEGKDVAFLTLGDPTIYSTVMYVHKRLEKMGHETAVVSGITSFCAAAASLNTTLCEKAEPLHIIPATYTDLEKATALEGSKVLMKSGKSIAKFKDQLRDYDAKIVECATMENEKIYDCKEELETLPGYFSVVVIKQEGDKKKENGHD